MIIILIYKKYSVDQDCSNYVDELLTLGLVPYSLLPTRITDSTATIIDHVFTNYNVDLNNKNMFCGLLTTDITDHLGMFVIISDTATPYKFPQRPLKENLLDLIMTLSMKL